MCDGNWGHFEFWSCPGKSNHWKVDVWQMFDCMFFWNMANFATMLILCVQHSIHFWRHSGCLQEWKRLFQTTLGFWCCSPGWSNDVIHLGPHRIVIWISCRLWTRYNYYSYRRQEEEKRASIMIVATATAKNVLLLTMMTSVTTISCSILLVDAFAAPRRRRPVRLHGGIVQ